jgi:hypothetical protein
VDAVEGGFVLCFPAILHPSVDDVDACVTVVVWEVFVALVVDLMENMLEVRVVE